MSPSVFADMMALLAQGCVPQNLTPEARDVQTKFYRRFLIDLEDAEFVRAVGVYVTERQPGDERGKFFPTVAELRSLARPLPTDVELAPIFRTIEGLRRHDVETGAYISAREVAEQCGTIAKEAFIAAGGSSVFVRLDRNDNRVFAMKRFFESYREAQKQGARNELLGPAPASVKALTDSTVKVLAMPAKVDGRDAWNRARGNG